MRKYKVGTKLRALIDCDYDIKKGDIIEIIEPTTFFSSYTLRGGKITRESGWDTKFVDDKTNFEPVKITNWRERIR